MGIPIWVAVYTACFFFGYGIGRAISRKHRSKGICDREWSGPEITDGLLDLPDVKEFFEAGGVISVSESPLGTPVVDFTFEAGNENQTQKFGRRVDKHDNPFFNASCAEVCRNAIRMMRESQRRNKAAF